MTMVSSASIVKHGCWWDDDLTYDILLKVLAVRRNHRPREQYVSVPALLLVFGGASILVRQLLESSEWRAVRLGLC